jgi:hypothetical protein
MSIDVTSCGVLELFDPNKKPFNGIVNAELLLTIILVVLYDYFRLNNGFGIFVDDVKN